MTTCTQPVSQHIPPADEPDLAQLDTIEAWPPRVRSSEERQEEEKERLDEKAMGLRTFGKTYRQIAASLGVSTSTAHAMVMRHLHRQRTKYEEHLSDFRDMELQKLQSVEPIHIRQARDGDHRSYALLLRAAQTKLQYMLKFPNQTMGEEVLRMIDPSKHVAKGYKEAVFEAEEQRRTMDNGRAMDNGQLTMDNAEGEQGRTSAEHVRTNPEHAAEHVPQPVDAASVADGGTFSTEPKSSRSRSRETMDSEREACQTGWPGLEPSLRRGEVPVAKVSRRTQGDSPKFCSTKLGTVPGAGRVAETGAEPRRGAAVSDPRRSPENSKFGRRSAEDIGVFRPVFCGCNPAQDW